MSQSIKIFFKPTCYISEEDNQLKASVQMVSDHKQKGGLNGHARAVAQAVHSIALATLVNTSYYLALGSKNLFLNCIHLNLELMVLGHYNAAMQNLIYSVIATVYVAIGIFIPSVLNGFKMEKPDDSSSSNSLTLDVEGQVESEVTRSPTPSLEGINLTSISSTQSEPSDSANFNFSKMHSLQDQIRLTNSSLNQPANSFISLSDKELIDQNDKSQSLDSLRRSSLISLDSVQNRIDNEHGSRNSRSSQQHSQVSSEMDLDSLSVSGDWAVIPDIKSFAIKSTNIRARDMIGACGVNLERQAYRTALNEYIRILKDDFDIDLNERLTTIEKWLRSSTYQNNPIVNALYRTLFYLTKPVAYDDKDPIYTHAKEQYEKYVTSLREVIAAKQNSSWKSDISEELKECLTLTRALCEVRFRSKNHGLLRGLLQLHEDEYDREHGVTEILAVTRENFAQVVMAKNKKVAGAPALMKVSSTQRSCRMAYGAIGIEDFLMTDIPFLRGKQVFKNDKGEERSFYYMRHPTPHVEGSPTWITLGAMSRITGLGHIESGEAIAPEFEGMLEAIAQRKESYLIQSHQRLNDLGKVENEDSRSQTLYRLQESHKNFHVVFQAVEGELFDRKGSYEKMETFADLKEAIKASFCIEGSPNRLPAFLEKDEEYRNFIIDQLLDQVHQTLFGGRSDISFGGQDPTEPGIDYPNREWQAFILAFYILQGDDLKFRLPNVKYFCTNCKNFFDRGGNRAMAEDRLHQEMSKREVTTDDLEATIANLIPVPLQSKGKAVIEKRLKPGLALAEILASLEDRQYLQEIRFKEGYKPDRFEVSKKEQRAVPLIEDVCTIQEMQEVFRALQGKPYCIIDNSIIQNNWQPYQGKSRDYLFGQVNNDLKRLRVHVDKAFYNGQALHDAEKIFDYLKVCKINESLALQVMAQMQQSILFDPFSGLMKAFQHDTLGLSVTDTSETNAIDVIITEDSVEVKAQNNLFYKTTNPESPYFRENPLAIFNTTVLVTIPKDGSASYAHWTWEVADVPV